MSESAVDVASIRDTLKKKGYSEEAIKEVLKWYDSSPEMKTPQGQKK